MLRTVDPLPDLILARRRGRPGLIEPFGDLAASKLRFQQCAVDAAHDFCLREIDHYLRRAAVLFQQLAVAVAGIVPWDEFAAPGFFQTTPAHAFDNLGALVFGAQALHLRQPFALRRGTEGILKKDQWQLKLLELLDEQPLMGSFACASGG